MTETPLKQAKRTSRPDGLRLSGDQRPHSASPCSFHLGQRSRHLLCSQPLSNPVCSPGNRACSMPRSSSHIVDKSLLAPSWVSGPLQWLGGWHRLIGGPGSHSANPRGPVICPGQMPNMGPAPWTVRVSVQAAGRCAGSHERAATCAHRHSHLCSTSHHPSSGSGTQPGKHLSSVPSARRCLG